LQKSFEDLKKENIAFENEEVQSRLKVEMLVQRVKDTHGKKMEFKDELLQIKKENLAISRHKDHAEMEMEEM
jgi:hypothetical protein